MPRTRCDISSRSEICKRFIQVLEQHLGLSLSAAYKLLGYTTPSTLYSINAGRSAPDLERLLRLSMLRDVKGRVPNLDWIITGRGSPMFKTTAPKDLPLSLPSDFINLLTNAPPNKIGAIKTLLD